MKEGSEYKLIITALILICILGSCIAPVSASVQYPTLRKYVSDEANLFSSSEIMTLNDRCAAIEKSTGVELAIVTVTDTGGQDVIQYAAKTGEINGVGSAKTNDGAVILFSLSNQPGWAIATGRGAESTLTDARTSQFLRDADPLLDSSQYYAGTESILTDIQNAYGERRAETLPGTDINIYDAYSTNMLAAVVCMAGAAIVIIISNLRNKR